MVRDGISRRVVLGAALAVFLAVMASSWLVTGSGTERTAAQALPTVLIAQAGDAGAILTGDNGMTLYVFDRDEANVSNCNDRCTETWPPLLLEEGDPLAPPDLAGTLTAFMRSDGRRQVAYNERPLYFFASDTQPGDISGDGVGGVWHLARPQEATAASPTPVPATPAPTPSPPPPPTPAPTAAPTPSPSPMPYEPPSGPPYEPPSYPY